MDELQWFAGIYIYRYPAGGYGSPRAHASPVLPNSVEMRKPVGEILVRLRRDNDNCTHTSLGCGMPKWVGFFLCKLHLSAFGCEVTRQ